MTSTNMIPKLLLMCVLAVPFCAASDYTDTRTDVRDFAAGGTVQVRLSVGDLRIVRGDTNKIRLRYTVRAKRESALGEAKVDFEVRGSEAHIEFHAPSHNTQFDTEIEVPQTTNLDVHMNVGDMTVEGIDGDKELTLKVGDLHVDTGRSPSYRTVDASTSIGDLNEDNFGETSGWLGKSIRYHGDGKYTLRAHVSVGDITLEGK